MHADKRFGGRWFEKREIFGVANEWPRTKTKKEGRP